VAAEAAAFRPSFAHLAFLIQVPDADIEALMAAEKGSQPTGREREILDERIAAARVWLEDYAPERARMAVQDDLPDAARSLDGEQRQFLAALAATVGPDAPPAPGDAWQAAIFATAAELALPPGRAFTAIYLAFLGRPNGPRAGWLLGGLEPAFVLRRLGEAAAANATMSTAGGAP
jgi:lysyl-tRNA synthetase class 1